MAISSRPESVLLQGFHLLHGASYGGKLPSVCCLAELTLNILVCLVSPSVNARPAGHLETSVS